MNFSITEEGYDFGGELVAVEKEFVPVAEAPQFSLEDYDAFVDIANQYQKDTLEMTEVLQGFAEEAAKCRYI